MIKSQLNKFTMAKAISTFLGENTEINGSIPELTEHLNSLNLKFGEIEDKDNEHKTVRKGKHDLKNSGKEIAIKKALGISGALNAYASKSGLIELRNKTQDTRSSLKEMRDTELLVRLKFIKDLAAEHLSSLETFGVTQAKYDSYLAVIRKYEESLGQTESSRAVQKGAKKTRAQLFRELDNLLYSIDRLIDGHLEDHPEFVRNYRMARKIFSPGIRHKQQNRAVANANIPDVTSQGNEPEIITSSS